MKPKSYISLRKTFRTMSSTPRRVLNYWRQLELSRGRREVPEESDTDYHALNAYYDQLETDLAAP